MLGRVGETLLRKWLLGDFGLDVVEVTSVGYGADVAARVWKVVTGANAYAVKWSGAGTNTGHQVAAYLADCGVPGVPEMVRTVDGGLWSVHAKKRLTVVPWIDGVRAAESGLSGEQWGAYGRLLRRVHDAELPDRLRESLPKHSHIDARMPAVEREVRTRLEAPEGDVQEELAGVWAEYDEVIADLCRNRPREPHGPRVACHGDPHIGNVLVGRSDAQDGVGRRDARGGGVAELHLIDWDDVILAPREQDLMFMLGGMGAVGPATAAEQGAFLAGYGQHELDEDAVRYYRHVRAYEDVIGWSHQAITGPDEAYALDVTKGILSTGLAALATR
ncbi:aminoglycoside phosphotransferase family protein [Kribbella solani]|uniref:phosphotransferase enzyme family protein n=1 Tax=Kribbella solani TaxID=236067 RepID=UPI0029B0A439|nr:aminoglycoside phosphotransferase family protein [Kribbella solani]MDX3000918.1 aminoglycoside phosphotransferase family protein [Kribbella solani]